MSLVEVLVAMTVLLIGVMGTAVLLDVANATTVKTRSREAATNVARELVEAARAVPYANLTPSAVEGQLQDQPGLADGSGAAGWSLRRRGFDYAVTATVCTMDDPRDGGGSHSAGGFCPDSVAADAPDTAGKVDRAPEDYKRVRIQAAWTQGNVAREVSQTTIVNNPGSAGGPAVRTLTLSGSNPVEDTLSAGNRLSFQLTTSSTPETLQWLLDGASQEPVTTGSGRGPWSFKWELGPAGLGGSPDPAGSVVDGVYLVAAEAFDEYSVAGPSRSLTVTLNRSGPDQVTGLVGGRTADPANPTREIVDLEWLETPERDIVGYAVFRRASDGTLTPVAGCPVAKVDSCVDADPPVGPEIEYVVYAYDNASDGTARRGTVASEVLTVGTGNAPPSAPTSLTVASSDGGQTLTWGRPVPDPLDPDGDDIDFYRVYRDGRLLANRYARWDDPAPVVTFRDDATGGVTHCYFVTAVDSKYGESAFRAQAPEGPCAP